MMKECDTDAKEKWYEFGEKREERNNQSFVEILSLSSRHFGLARELESFFVILKSVLSKILLEMNIVQIRTSTQSSRDTHDLDDSSPTVGLRLSLCTIALRRRILCQTSKFLVSETRNIRRARVVIWTRLRRCKEKRADAIRKTRSINGNL